MRKARIGGIILLILSLILTTFIFYLVFVNISISTTDSVSAAQHYHDRYPLYCLYLLISAFLSSVVTFSQYLLLKNKNFRNVSSHWKIFAKVVPHAVFISFLVLSIFLWFVYWRWNEEPLNYPHYPNYEMQAFHNGIILRINSLLIPILLCIGTLVLTTAQCFLVLKNYSKVSQRGVPRFL